jgi:hypothetical protein
VSLAASAPTILFARRHPQGITGADSIEPEVQMALNV